MGAASATHRALCRAPEHHPVFVAGQLKISLHIFVFISVFYFFRTPRPVSVKQMEHEEDEDGISDENIKRNPDFQK